MKSVFLSVCFFFTAVLILLLKGIGWTLDRSLGAIAHEVHGDAKGQNLLQVLWVALG
jgi:hypothetical protein